MEAFREFKRDLGSGKPDEPRQASSRPTASTSTCVFSSTTRRDGAHALPYRHGRQPRRCGDALRRSGSAARRTAARCVPSYMATGEERHSTRGRARLLFEMLQGEVITEGFQQRSGEGRAGPLPVLQELQERVPDAASTWRRTRRSSSRATTRDAVGPCGSYAFGLINHWGDGRIRAAPRERLHAGAAVQFAGQVGARRRTGASAARIRRAEFQTRLPDGAEARRSQKPGRQEAEGGRTSA
ncbi:MAG: hypothetical protein MZW92_07540 [Comamonadaceae bacterium]|nr:hypothetical protein [Comamonadaceae bacterium]